MANWQYGWAVTNESYGSTTTSAGPYAHTVTNNPILPGTITIFRAAIAVATDDGNGNITGASIASGSVNYATGAVTFTFTGAQTNGLALTINYTASTINVTLVNADHHVFNLKQVMKQAGWTVPSSSDGTTFNSSGDQITQRGSGANGINNNSAWFRIRAPNRNTELLWQRSTTTAGSWYLAVSNVGFTGGSPSATQTPTASDQYGMWGHLGASTTIGYTDWTNATTGTITNDHTNAAADASAPYGVFHFMFPKNSATVGNCYTGFVVDSLASGTYNPLDVDPYTYWIAGATPYAFGINQNGAALGSGVAVATVNGTLQDALVYNIWPSTFNASPYTGYDDLMPIWWFWNSNVLTFKGQSFYFKWDLATNGSPTKPTPTLITQFSVNDSVVVGYWVLPWNGGSITIG